MKLPEGSEYVALGSSYAAGPGLGDRVAGSPRRAGRSTHNYAHVVAHRLGLRLIDASFSGATIAQILGKEESAGSGRQLDSVSPDTRLVTLTGGGNDVGYIGYLSLASLPWLVRTVTGAGRRLVDLADEAAARRKAVALADNLVELFDQIRSRAPRATIVVTDYLALLPPDGTADAPPLRRDDAQRGFRYWQLVNLTLRQATARAGALFADVSSASLPHHAWSTEPWTERFTLVGAHAAPYHPTRAGMSQVAAAVETALAGA
jgi:lysophospholipase L1-like esterase